MSRACTRLLTLEHHEAEAQRLETIRGQVSVPSTLPEYSTFAVDGRPDLSVVIYNWATPKHVEKIRSLVKPRASARRRRWQLPTG